MRSSRFTQRLRLVDRIRPSIGACLVAAAAVSASLGGSLTTAGSTAELAVEPQVGADVTLAGWISMTDESAGGEFLLGTTVASNAFVDTNGWISTVPAPHSSPQLVRAGSTDTTRFVTRPVGALPFVRLATGVVGADLAMDRSPTDLQTRFRQYLTWGWESQKDVHGVVIVDHVGDIAAYLCGAGSTMACDVTARVLMPHAGEPSHELSFGSVRDVIVDLPPEEQGHGRFLALAVVRREPRTAAELADLVLLGHSKPDPAADRLGGERLVAPTDTAGAWGAATALEVSLDAAWIAAHRLAGRDVDFERYVAIASAEAESVLRIGDRVLLLDGAPVGRGTFMAVAGDRETDSLFTVVRGDSPISIRAADVNPGAVGILEAARTTVERPAMVVRSGTSGPSAGLVSALAYLDVITPGDLTSGLTVAGTGTVTPHGYVGEVDGVELKAAAAADAGADVLFVHPDDINDALSGAAGGLDVVAIRSVNDALEWLTHVGARDEREV